MWRTIKKKAQRTSIFNSGFAFGFTWFAPEVVPICCVLGGVCLGMTCVNYVGGMLAETI